ncbi:MAG: c-type cytochrome [Acidobacteria bacterium]|nr:c-type cytochrome [Acidobacteriota bacterium]
MKKILLSLSIVIWLALAWGCAASDPHVQKLARGKYLIENVGMCADCHTPRTQRGELDLARSLQGSPLSIAPTVPMPWAQAAPAIAGLPSLTEAEAAKFLQTGDLPAGRHVRPPMPPFRLSREDAEAVAAYLKTLGSKQS